MRTIAYPRKCPSCAERLRFGANTITERGQMVFVCPSCAQKFQPRYQLYPLKGMLLVVFVVPFVSILPGVFGGVASSVAGLLVIFWSFGLEVST